MEFTETCKQIDLVGIMLFTFVGVIFLSVLFFFARNFNLI